jgi:Domain of unknown function (DUF4386)
MTAKTEPSSGRDSTRRAQTTLRRYALIAGVGYVVLFVLGIFANFFVREGLVVTGDAAQTAANILESEGLFRMGMVSFLVVFAVDVIVAWALYVLFKKVDENVSLVTAWFRIVYTVFLGVAVMFFYQAIQLLSGSEFLSVFDAGQLEAQALLAVDAFNSTWLIGLLVFGVHLIFLGWLVVKSSAPRVLGYVLMVAGLAYVADTLAHTVLANYVDYENVFLAIVAVPSVIAEGWMGLWLLFKGGRKELSVASSNV